MDADFLKFLLRFLGTVLLMVAGAGAGAAVCVKRKVEQRRIYTLSRLFIYMRELLASQALTGEELLERAKAYPDFASLGLRSCACLEKLPLPEELPLPIRQEIRSDLLQISMAPRETACRTLQHVAVLCRDNAAEKEREVQMAEKLWPRLGLCLGALAAILLW